MQRTSIPLASSSSNIKGSFSLPISDRNKTQKSYNASQNRTTWYMLDRTHAVKRERRQWNSEPERREWMRRTLRMAAEGSSWQVSGSEGDTVSKCPEVWAVTYLSSVSFQHFDTSWTETEALHIYLEIETSDKSLLLQPKLNRRNQMRILLGVEQLCTYHHCYEWAS